MWPYIVLAVVLALLALVIGLLCIPVYADFAIDRYESTRSRIKISWLFGLLRKEPGKHKKAPSEEKRDGRAGKASQRARVFTRIARVDGFPRRTGKFTRDIVKQVRLLEINAQGRFGLEAAAETGTLFSIIGSIIGSSSSPRVPHWWIWLGPAIDDRVIEGTVSGKARVFPIRLLPPVISFLFSAQGRKAIRAYLSARSDNEESLKTNST